MKTKPSDISIRKRFSTNFWILCGILFSVTLISTLILSPRLVVMQGVYELGQIADKNIKATSDFFIEDEAATAQQREIARNSVLTVYDYNKPLVGTLTRQIEKAFPYPGRFLRRRVAPIGHPRRYSFQNHGFKAGI
ncbi:MAG: hypothetical protein R2875_08635 [Desulfobacterales bacterium]